MKKRYITIYLLFILLGSFFLGCNDQRIKSIETNGFEQIDIKINNQEKGIQIDFKYNNISDCDEYNQELNEKIISFGILISYKNDIDKNDFIVGNIEYNNNIILNDSNNYSYLFDNDLEDNFKKYVSVRLYYKYESKKEIKFRYSDKLYTESIYNLAVSNPGVFSNQIIEAFKEEIKTITLELDYEKYVIYCDEATYQAKIISPLDYEVINIIITINDEAKFSEDVILKVNDSIVSQVDYHIEDDKISLIVKDNKIKEIDLKIDFENKLVTINDLKLKLSYQVNNYFYEIAIEIIDDSLFSPRFILKLNGEEVEDGYTLTNKTLTFNYNDNIIREIKITLDTTNYIVSSCSDRYQVRIDKPLDYIYIKTIITLNEGLVLSNNFKLIVNDVEADDKYIKVEMQDEIVVVTYQINDPNWTKPY